MIKAVYFDIDDTLFCFSEGSRIGMQAVEQYVSDNLGVSKAKLKEAITYAQQKIGDRIGVDSGAFHNRQIRFQVALEYLKAPIFPHATNMYHAYWDTLLDMAVPEPGIEVLLERLKQAGIYIGIGTDMTSYIQYEKLKRLGLDSYISGMVTSEEAGIDKPGEQFFALCIEKAGCKADECLFIGDNLIKDVYGPRMVGMKSVCYRKYSKVTALEEAWCMESYESCVKESQVILGPITICE